MTYGNEPRNQSERRGAARDKARALRENRRRRERRRRWFLQGGIAGGLIVIIVVVVLVVANGVRPASAGPENMLSDGIVIGKDFKAVRTAAIPANGKPVPTTRDKKSSVVTIRIYVDYFCPLCGQFETANEPQISAWLKSGAATLEIHPVSILDRSSLGSRYSSRAANAAACVANYSPDDFWAFTKAMYAKQPKEGTSGLSNAQIKSVVSKAGVQDLGDINPCINTEKFASWVTDATERAANGPLPDSNVKTAATTPTVIVDGLSYQASNWGSASDFDAFVVQAAGASFDSGDSTPTPTPTPTTIPTLSN
jgi:protein-disulfide isomerase